jgi:uncharacterized membrane protein YphA (DoxX/SURF4 family)
VGLVFLSNGLAKALDRQNTTWGPLSFSLITRGSAKNIAQGAAVHSHIALVSSFYRTTVIPHWGFFGVFLTVAELALGVALLLGVLTRVASIGGLLLIAPIWVMLWHTGDYLWDYPADLAPLVLLAVVPTGRILGLDGLLHRRIPHWPF